METEHNWFVRHCIWLRDHAGALVATFGMIVILYAIGGLLAYAFFQLDYYFSRPLAGDVIPPEVTQMVAWGIRAITLVAGMAAIYFHTNNMPSWRLGTMWIGGIGALLLLLHAYGIAAKIMDGQYSAVATIEEVEAIDIGSINNQIATLQAQKAEIRADRDVAIATAQQGIESVKDQVPGLSTEDNVTIRGFQADKDRVMQEASAKIANIDARILELQSESRTTSTTATQSTASRDDFNPLFNVMARVVGVNFDPAKSPSDGRKYVSGMIFFTLFFGFGEIALIFCLTAPYAALQVVSMRKREDRTLSPDDYDLWLAYKKRRDAQLKPRDDDDEGAGRIPINQEYYWADKIEKAQASAIGIEGIVNYYFPDHTVPEFEAKLKNAMNNGWVTQEQFDDITDPNRRQRRIAERQAAKDRQLSRQDEKQARIVGTTDTSINGTGPLPKGKDDADNTQPA